MPDDNDPKDDFALAERLDAALDEDDREDKIPESELISSLPFKESLLLSEWIRS